MIGVYIWCILLIIIAVSLLPWWFIPSCIVYYFVVYGIDWHKMAMDAKRKSRKRVSAFNS